MNPAVDQRIRDVKAGLLERWAPDGEPIGELVRALDHEPLTAPKLPLLTMMFRGFTRARLESHEVRAPVVDPIGGRRWIWSFYVRTWVGFKNDPVAAQETLDVLTPQVVVALEEDRSLGGIAVDAAMESGDVAVSRPKAGNPTLILTSICVVETEESLT